MEFFNNKENEPLRFKLNVEGININSIEPRLILSADNKNYLFFGSIEENVCVFNIPKLNLYEKGNRGSIKFEIVSEDLYFNIWNDSFEINSKATITFEQVVTEEKTERPYIPKISASAVLEKNVPKPISKTEVKNTDASDSKTKLNTSNTTKSTVKEDVKKSKFDDLNELMDFSTFLKQDS